MPDWLLPFIVFDLIVTTAVVLIVVRRRRQSPGGEAPGIPSISQAFRDFRGLADFAKEKHAWMGEYARNNWSGDPAQLPGMIQSMLGELEKEAGNRNLSLDREILKTMLVRSLQAHRIGRRAEVRKAIEKVA